MVEDLSEGAAHLKATGKQVLHIVSAEPANARAGQKVLGIFAELGPESELMLALPCGMLARRRKLGAVPIVE